MDDKVVKEALSYALGADLHEDWCDQELYSYFLRAQKAFTELKNYKQALEEACYKNGDKRNEVDIDIEWLLSNEDIASKCLTDFNVFKKLFKAGIITIKRFTKRKLTDEEIAMAGSDYADGKENILRSFSQMSSASKGENLAAARLAIELVYEKTMAGEAITEEELEEMATVIHEEWLKRNSWVFDPNYGDPKLAVPYSQLSKEEQDKDKAQIGPAQRKVQDYIDGLIDVDQLLSQYNLTSSSKKI